MNIAGGTRYDTNVEQDLVDGFDRVRNTFAARGVPVIVGEWGLLSYDYTRPGIIERGELLKFFEAVGYQARIRKFTTMLWDAGSFLNRNTLQWRDPGLLALMKTSVTTRSATASSDPPTQAAATGTTASFTIPTQFRGDQLATMEARYADGSAAGPANWTTYKEFWSNFQPDYAANTILLKPEFFAEVNDGPVTLTFHFWSGTQITYRLTKSGGTVTGAVG
ncbi:hypothetical protein [Micromonospora sp. NBC_00617]|uniref:hypothetical protein n=1 Tax=Micromonospora sp. NBC_00617 TaxID=2903587 RepID=UPI0030E1F272